MLNEKQRGDFFSKVPEICGTSEDCIGVNYSDGGLLYILTFLLRPLTGGTIKMYSRAHCPEYQPGPVVRPNGLQRHDQAVTCDGSKHSSFDMDFWNNKSRIPNIINGGGYVNKRWIDQEGVDDDS